MNEVNCTERVGTFKFTRKVQFADAHCSLRHPTKPAADCGVTHTEAGWTKKVGCNERM
jgi:hypothetical protein